MRLPVPLTAIAVNLLLASSVTAGQSEDQGSPWELDLTNAFRFENYSTYGDRFASPYYILGDQHHDDMSISVSRRFSPYESTALRVSGAYNRSDYRGEQKDGVLEGGSFAWEKGDTSLPFRFNAGDIFVQQSERTIQRSLKGGIIELQPGPTGCADHSIQVFSGFSASLYNHLDPGDDLYSGLSWLVKHDRYGDYLFSVVKNFRQAQEEMGLASQSQTVAGLSMEKGFSWASQQFTIESELAHFYGQLANAVPGNDDNLRDYAVFAAIAGNSSVQPLTYRFSWEQNGENFAPNGAGVSTDARRLEGMGGWRFSGGMEIEGRYQFDQSGFFSANPTSNRTAGIRLYGTPLPGARPDLLFSLDAFRSTSEDDAGWFKTRSDSVNSEISLQLDEITGLRFGGGFRQNNDLLNDQESRDHQAFASLSRSFSLYGFDGSISPGLNYSRSSSPWNESEQFDPTLSLSIAKGEHRMDLYYNASLQDTLDDGGIDVRTYRSSLSYSFVRDAHSLNLYVDSFGRQPDLNENTEAYRVGFLYTYHLYRPAAALPSMVPTGQEIAKLPADIAGFLALRPGSMLDEINNSLTQLPTEPPCRKCDLLIYDAPLLSGIQPQQKLILERQGNRLLRSWLVIDLANRDGFTTPGKVYNEIRSRLTRKLGQPTFIVELGEFTDTLATDLATGRFARLMEWNTESGMLRLGIPERIDGRVRIEMVLAERLGSPQDRRWGLKEVF